METNKKPSNTNNNQQKKAQTGKTNKKETESSILSLIIGPFLTFFNSMVGLIGFDSFIGVAISIFLVFTLSYSLKILFTGGAKPVEKRKKTPTPKKEN